MAKPTGHIIKRLRAMMNNPTYVSETIHAYIIPSGDAHQNEYVAPCHKRRQFVCGFSGSAGTAIVTEDKALLWTDGRYFLQAEQELDENWTLMKDGLPDTLTPEAWLCKNVSIGSKIGVDPFLISLDTWRMYAKVLKSSGHSFVRVDKNLIDIVWAESGAPQKPSSNLIALGIKYTGKTWQDKIESIRDHLMENNAYALVVAALDEVAWLFNLRGADIAFNPVFFAYAIVTMDDVSLFIDEERLTHNIKEHLSLNGIEQQALKVYPYESITEQLRIIAGEDKRVWISSRCSSALASLVPEMHLITDLSPVCYSKAIKNETEIEGMRKSHIRDSAALCEYFHWLEKEIHKGYLNEVTAADGLEKFRRQEDDFVSLSFETISGSGPNGAIIHYRPDIATARKLSPNEMYLCDSGAQYLDGTTDVTRTMHFGTPTQHEKECYTMVLKGHIQLAKAVFPKGTRGHVLDILARKPLWDCGLDYFHGTGHGVGAFLNVHEGPHGISPKVSEDKPLEPGMFVTNEPGYYEDDNFGIRIENVMLVKQVNLKFNLDKKYYGLEPITLVPIQKKLLILEVLTDKEINWLNEYHSLCEDKIGQYLLDKGKKDVHQWLLRETQKLV